MKRRKSVLVTGGAGFIGSHVVDALINQGESVLVIDNLIGGHLKNLEQHKNQELLEFVDLDVVTLNPSNKLFKEVYKVFHLAGVGDIVPSIANPIHYFKNNVMGTANILEAVRANSVESFVYAASSSCYGFAKTPTNELNEINPMYPYALTKYLGEQAVFHWSKVYGIRANSICIFNAFGPRVRTSGAYGAVFGVFFKQKLAGEPLTIVGSGEQQRDFVFASDVAEAFILAGRYKGSCQRFNIGSGNPKKIIELANLIGGKKVFIPSRPGEPEITHADITKANKLLGWSPKISFEQGVKDMLNSLESWSEAPLWTPESIADATKLWFKYLGTDET